jgi:hypothetical protein
MARAQPLSSTYAHTIGLRDLLAVAAYRLSIPWPRVLAQRDGL